jgi:hypothetical protein
VGATDLGTFAQSVTKLQRRLERFRGKRSLSTKRMLISCPECGNEVSHKAPTCPKCGANIAYPSFYTTVESDGLNIKWLLCDWYNEDADDSVYGSLQPIGMLCDRTDDEEMTELTVKTGRRLLEAMRNRLMQLPERSAEACELQLTLQYVQAARDFATLIRGCFHSEHKLTPDRIRPNLDLVLQRLETIKASCKNEDDIRLITSEIEECRKFGAKILAVGRGVSG